MTSAINTRLLNLPRHTQTAGHPSKPADIHRPLMPMSGTYIGA